jgi:very-short-patch-repair endonuclease
MQDRPSEIVELAVKQAKDLAEALARSSIDMAFERCESPIEKALVPALLLSAIAVDEFLYSSNVIANHLTFRGLEEADYVVSRARNSYGAVIFCQPEVAGYRGDFAVLAYSKEPLLKVSVIVECDGHDFHEKTKEQAERDKRRDREIMAAGYRVMRFTGAEIWRDPFRVAIEVMDLLSKDLQAMISAHKKGAI